MEPMKVPTKECAEGWNKIIDPVIEQCQLAGIEILQIKEKFGWLRIYLKGPFWDGPEIPEHILDALDDAEAASKVTCEICGDPGTRVGKHYLRTLCPIHAAEHETGR